MKHITPQQMIAFHDELAMEKEAGFGLLRKGYQALAASPRLRQAVGYGSSLLPSTYGRQLLLGAGTGAAVGGMSADEGKGTAGALKGALVGAGLAGGRILATQKGRKAAVTGLKHFGERQRYGVTGTFGKHVGKSKKQQLAHAEKIGLVPRKVDPKKFKDIDEAPGLIERARARIAGREAVGARAKAISKAKEHRQEAVKAFRSGYMHAPGVVSGMLDDPRAVLKGAWRRAGTPGKVFAGLGAYETGKGLIEKPEPGGPGRLEKGLRGAGSTVGWLVAPHAILGGHLIGTAGGAVGGAAGKIGDIGVRAAKRKATGTVAPPPSAYYPQEGGE